MTGLRVCGLDHIVLRVRDVAKSIAWYGCVLGAKEERIVSGIDLHQLRLGAALIDLVPERSDKEEIDVAFVKERRNNMDHFCVQLEFFDEQTIRNHLKCCGVDSGKVERRYGALGYGPSMYITDPDGNTVELKGPPNKKQTETVGSAERPTENE